jgi:glycosyltransferase involved in cell wall biosynthesis
MKSKILYLFTAEYPYGSHESYLENEIHFLAENFDTVFLFPRNNSKGNIRKVPKNVIITNADASLDYSSGKIMFGNIALISKILFIEFLNTNNKVYFLQNLREWNSSICQCIQLAKIIIAHIQTNLQDKSAQVVYYSYWMNDWALMLSILKEKKKIRSFVFRVLGFDIYDERWEKGYMPFRYYIYSKTDRIYTVSESAEKYIKNKNIFPEKVMCSYFGTNDYGPATSLPQKENFVLYSCSNIIKLKRVNLIVEILKHIPFEVKWIHRGDGEAKAELLEQVKKLPPHITFELLPRVNDYSEILEWFKNTPVSLFINISESEGLPVTLIESISMGVPVLATNVGGTSEVVNEQTGILIEKDFDPASIALTISSFKEGNKNSAEFRRGVRAFWLEKFSASENYTKFCELLLSEAEKKLN